MNDMTKIEPPDLSSVAQLEIALAKALPELDGAKKNSANPHFKSKYADLSAVIDAIRPVAEHGVWYRQVLHESERGVTVETLYTGFGATISAGTLFMPADKANAQGFGSALTYARRYGLQAAFGLATEDDDGNEASKPRTQAKKPEPAISDEQFAKLEQMIPAAKITPAQFCQTFGCEKVRTLPASRFDAAVERLNDRLSELANRQTNREAAHA